MTERGRFLYQDSDGVVFIKFEHPGKGVPIESLIPKSARGDNFKTFKLQEYFDLADLVLAAPSDWAEFCNGLNIKGATKQNPALVTPPSLNLDFLKLRSGNGMHLKRTEDLFTIVRAYWKSKNDLGLEPGLVATLWHSGISSTDIISYIKRCTNPEGKLELNGFTDERGFTIINAVTNIYKTVKSLSFDHILQQTELSNVIEAWFTATRSVKLGSPEMSNPVLLWAEYRRLGLVNQAGKINLNNVEKLARFIFKADKTPDINTVYEWASTHLSLELNMFSESSEASKKLLKKKRKQGRVNRRRGNR